MSSSTPLPEQRRIAEILDTLDEAIRKTEQVIAKLQQMKQGLLRDLLTQGIDENGELRDPERHPEQFKDSVLGRIPREWEGVAVADVARQITDGDHHTPIRASAGVLLLSARNVLNGTLALDDVDYVPEHEYQRMIRRCHPEPGDILMSCSGTIGRVAMVPDGLRCVLVRSAALIKFERNRVASRFAEWVLQSEAVKGQILAGQRQAAQPNLFQSEIAVLRFPLPPYSEQIRIGSALDQLQSRVSRETSQIEKLRTLKHGLMDDLLTGRVRVNVRADTAA